MYLLLFPLSFSKPCLTYLHCCDLIPHYLQGNYGSEWKMWADIYNVSIFAGSLDFSPLDWIHGALCDLQTLSKKVTGVPKGLTVAGSRRRNHIKKGRKPQQGMGCNGDRFSSFSLQPVTVTGSVCTTNLQCLCQILLSQNQETHAHVPSKGSELSTEAKEMVWKVPLPAGTPAGDKLCSQDNFARPF